MELTYNGNKVYYEVYGEGRPLLVLNGIMMSTASWNIFINAFSKNNKLILMDMLDQGKSERMVGKPYSQKDQVEAVKAVIDQLGFDKVSIVGVSYGGEVVIQFAEKYCDRIDKLVLSNTTAVTYPLLADFGKAWNLAGEQENPGEQYYYTTIPIIYSPTFYANRIDWMRRRESVLIPFMNDKKVMATFKRLVDSAEKLNAVEDLGKITCDTLIITCDQDMLTPTQFQNQLKDNIPNSEIIMLPGCGHASMYEKPQLWGSIVLGFVNTVEEIVLL